MEIKRCQEEHVLRDVIYDYIHIKYDIIWQLINTKEFQRLKRIKQLGNLSQVFPGCVHTRFNHSIGVYHVVLKMLELEPLQHLSDYEQLTVMVAGLLHDIGHGPFSHTFEHIFHTNHEQKTIDIILGDTEVHNVLLTISKDFPKDVASVIGKTHPNPLLIEMISSQIDADRMDYLLRDSYFAGVTYGHFDMSRILRTLRVKDNHIVFKQSGVQAIENYILARYHMYWQVYYHPVSRGCDHLLHHILKRVCDLYDEGYKFKENLDYLLPFIKNNYSLEDYLSLDDTILYYYLHIFTRSHDIILQDLSKRFIDRHLYVYDSIDKLSSIKELSESLGYPSRYYIETDMTTQTPYVHYNISYIEEIKILKESGDIVSLPEESEIVQAILHTKVKQDQKVFYIKEVLENEKTNNL